MCQQNLFSDQFLMGPFKKIFTVPYEIFLHGRGCLSAKTSTDNMTDTAKWPNPERVKFSISVLRPVNTMKTTKI